MGRRNSNETKAILTGWRHLLAALISAAAIGCSGTISDVDTAFTADALSGDLAQGKRVTTNASWHASSAYATDGVISTSHYMNLAGGAVWVQVDLGQSYSISTVRLWHYFGDGRTYHDVIVQLAPVADFSSGVTTVFNNDGDNNVGRGAGTDLEYKETSAGKTIALSTPVSARFIRCWSNGSNVNAYNHYVEIAAYGAAGSPGAADAGTTADAGAPSGGTADAGAPPPVPSPGPSGAAPSVSVSGNRLVDQYGNTVQLHGVNRSGAEYACAEGWGIFDGPTDDDTSIGYIKAWNVNAIRLPMNEDCWLGINGVNSAYSGANYQSAIVDYVNRLNAHGMIVILNLHFSAPGTTVPDGQFPMADRDHSNDFWTSVATVFKNNPSVMFDLFNEPYPDSNNDTTAAWTCVLNGGTCPGVPFVAAGMQEMTNAVRATGATQPLMIGGPQYAGVVDQWLQYKPNDPLHQLVASIHIYGLPLDSPCRLQSCWDGTMAPLATTTPIVIGELGDTDCTSNFAPPLMTWADQHGVSYTPWAWNVGSCGGEPSLIRDYTGTPTPYGLGVKQHLLSLP
jgi:hypothetical protein